MNVNQPSTQSSFTSEMEYELLDDEYPNYDLSFKVIVIGNSGVGKSSLSIKTEKNFFEKNYLATVGFEFFSFNIRFDRQNVVKLQIWDTWGQEIYRSLNTNFYRNSSLAVLVYSIDDQKSFDDIASWLKDLKLHSSPNIKIFLIGNKSDLESRRKVSKEMGEKFKDDYGMDLFLETSAKQGTNTKELFIEAAKLLYSDYIQTKSNRKRRDNEGKLLNQKNNKKSNCCD